MNRNNIKLKFYNILIHQLCLDHNYFSRFSDNGENIMLVKELHADPLDCYEILAAVEYEFRISISDDIFLSSDVTLGDFINLIEKLVNYE